MEFHGPVTTVRIYPMYYESEEQQTQILDLLKRNPGIDEVWFSTLEGNDSMAKHAELAEMSAAFAEKVRALGVRVSLQLSSCIGHFAAPRTADGFPWTEDDLMVDSYGKTVSGICCPTSKTFVDWTGKALALYCAKIHPDSAYIDDDLRFQNHGAIHDACFCHRCLDAFAEFAGKRYSREELTALLDSDSRESIRLQWVKFHRIQMADFCREISEAVHAASPETEMGLQTANSEMGYNGWNFELCYKAMAEATGRPCRVRIGSGVWNDYNPHTFLRKGLLTGCDVADARASGAVGVMTMEIENCPCNATSKSNYAMQLEAALCMAYGCNSSSMQSGSLWEAGGECMEKFFRMYSSNHAYFSMLSGISRESVNAGLNLVVNDEFMENPKNPEKPYEWYVFQVDDAEEFVQFGIPLMFNRQLAASGGNASLVTLNSAKSMTKENFMRCLRDGALLTGNAYLELQRRGLVDFAKVKAECAHELNMSCTRLTEHPINGDGAHASWRGFLFPDTVAFTPECSSKAQPLAVYADDKAGRLAAWCLESDYGKMAVFGVSGNFSRQINPWQIEMLRNLADWVGQAPMPARLNGWLPLVAIPATDKSGKVCAVTVVNAGIEPCADAVLEIRNPVGTSLSWFRMGDEQKRIGVEQRTDGQSTIRVKLPELGAWQIATVVCG